MSHIRFDYADEILSSCARSQLAAFVAKESVHEEGLSIPTGTYHNPGSDESCSILHQQHAEHYSRPSPALYTKQLSKNTMAEEDDKSDGDKQYFSIDKRFRRFLQSVLHVHNHNSETAGNLHRVTLNQFSDEEAITAILAASQDHEGGAWDTLLDFDAVDTEWILDPLEHASSVLDIAANLTIGHGGMEHLNHKRKKANRKRIQDAVSDKIKFPERGRDPNFAVPSIDIYPEYDGELLKVKPRRKVDKNLEDGVMKDSDEFGSQLNWATEDNPDGVPIVKEAFDQGECGSCWAFAATGSLEASVSRREAHEAYTEYLERATLRREEKSVREIHWEALEFAKSVEQATFKMANLSIQELIDCDTAADQGCIGGNPLLAFFFIHRYGLTSWNQYPYVGFEDGCHTKHVGRPVAKVQSWGLLAPNHENHIELVLRYVGPVAVGVNGGERSFLGYQDGIFDKPSCRQGANHALLIVGYGEEENDYGEVIKYWIARNSWGRGWGIDGYIKIRRGDGLKGTPGVCGIARSPSVALGGILLADRHRLSPYHAPVPSEPGSEPLSTREPPTVCIQLGIGSCSTMLETFESHRALIVGLIGIFCATLLAVWPLTGQCRRRRQRRKARRQLLTREGLNPIADDPPLPPPTEADSLLGSRNATTYSA